MPMVTAAHFLLVLWICFPSCISQVLIILLQVCYFLASLLPISLIKTVLSSFQTPTMTTRGFLYHRLDLNNELQGASSLPSTLLPRSFLLLLHSLHFLFLINSSQLTIPLLPFLNNSLLKVK